MVRCSVDVGRLDCAITEELSTFGTEVRQSDRE